jgi:hypothetical protein
VDVRTGEGQWFVQGHNLWVIVLCEVNGGSDRGKWEHRKVGVSSYQTTRPIGKFTRTAGHLRGLGPHAKVCFVIELLKGRN